jgi:hypothetical protein
MTFPRVLIFVFVAMLGGLITAPASLAEEVATSPSSNWQVVYEQDREGARVAGDKAALIEAIRAGEEVRVYWASSRVEHLVDAGFLTIFGGEVFAQLATITGQRPSRPGESATIALAENGATWTALISTNGQFKYPIKWFVKR